MIDWKKIYSDIVTPVINNFTSPPPIAVLIVLSVILLSGVGLITWSSGKGRLIGLMLVFIVSFVAYMVISGYFRVKNNKAHFETGTVTKKITKIVSKKNIALDQTYSDTIYYIEMNVSGAHILSEEGEGDYFATKNGKHEYLIDHSLYEQLKEQENINAVFMPGITKAVHFVVMPDGSVVK